MNKIELRKRTPEERAAYAEGFAAGYQKGLEPQTVVLRTNLTLERSDYDKILEGLDIQKNNGVMLLGPGVEFCGVAPRDAEIEIIRKAAKDEP